MSRGNDTQNTSFLDVCLALKSNIFKTLNVADVYIVREINKDSYKCESICNENVSIQSLCLQNITPEVGDVVLVLFTNTDFRAKLNTYKVGQSSSSSISTLYHEKSYGIIIGIIYKVNGGTTNA